MYTCPGLAPFKVNFKAYSLCNSHFPFVWAIDMQKITWNDH
jgi:hypothetical protein